MSSKKKADLNKFKVVFGYTLLFISVILFTSFISYMYNWRVDQSSVNSLLDRNIQVENILGKIGASISHFLIFKLFGIASFIFPVILLISSYYLLFNKKILELIKKINWLLLLIVWTTLLSGYLSNYFPIQSGIVGFEINSFLETYIGNIGILLIIGFIFVLSIAILWNITPYSLFTLLKNTTLINKQKEKSFDDDVEEKTYPDLNLEESGLARLIRAGFGVLNLITFFTIGPKEARAWTLKNNSTAPEAAGVIHTDFQKGFIKQKLYHIMIILNLKLNKLQKMLDVFELRDQNIKLKMETYFILDLMFKI